jgi:hypothetical protein
MCSSKTRRPRDCAPGRSAINFGARDVSLSIWARRTFRYQFGRVGRFAINFGHWGTLLVDLLRLVSGYFSW